VSTRHSKWTLAGQGSGIDFVGEDTQSECFIDGLIEADEELQQGLAATANQHGVGAVFVGGGSNATNGAQPADGDIAILDQLGDVGKREGCNRTVAFRFLFTLRVLAARWRDSTAEAPRCD